MIRSLLFFLPPETAHKLAILGLQIMQKIPYLIPLIQRYYGRKTPLVPKQIAGLWLKNPVGLAAGFDKNAKVVRALAAFGFGFIEIGSVTSRPQVGNKRPRLFRLTSQRAIINHMGMNNDGVDAVVQRLSDRPCDVVIGANIAKNTDTPPQQAIDDYLDCFIKLHSLVDYFTINISCPNVPSDPFLRERDFLCTLFERLQNFNHSRALVRPIFVKVSPDSSEGLLEILSDLIKAQKITGVIATNTSTDRSILSLPSCHQGGISGLPLFEKSNEMIALLRKHLPHDCVVIGVGGIMSAEQGYRKIELGADLVQIYSGLVFNGLSLISEMVQTIKKMNEKSQGEGEHTDH